jgi:ligand-binding SRPBCC domain-containing protein
MIKKIYQEQILPITLEEAWAFFATPKNLNEVTPKNLDFKILSDLPEKMYEGLIIRYKIKPMLNIPLDWCTEITHIDELSYFVDEQRQGPYKMWHHEHHFSATKDGVLMKDILHYDVGLSLFGTIAGWLFVDKKVKEIFEFRKEALDTYFQKKELIK